MLVAGMLVPNMGSWLLVCWCPALDSGCCFAVLQHGKLFASLLVPSMGFWLLVYWSPTWDTGCWFVGLQHGIRLSEFRIISYFLAI